MYEISWHLSLYIVLCHLIIVVHVLVVDLLVSIINLRLLLLVGLVLGGRCCCWMLLALHMLSQDGRIISSLINHLLLLLLLLLFSLGVVAGLDLLESFERDTHIVSLHLIGISQDFILYLDALVSGRPDHWLVAKRTLNAICLGMQIHLINLLDLELLKSLIQRGFHLRIYPLPETFLMEQMIAWCFQDRLA